MGFRAPAQPIPEIPEIIRSVHREYGYWVDPHTACGFKALSPDEKHLVLATAHPAKFPDLYEKAGMEKPTSPVLQQLLEKTRSSMTRQFPRLRSGLLSKRILRKPANDCFARFDSPRA